MAKTRILVVDDEDSVARYMQKKLESLGYAVPAIAFSGEEAIREAAATRPDLILMDIRLPGGLDGVEATGKIQARFNIPVVYLTAYADDETLQRAKISEPYGYILKPSNEVELQTTISIALYKHKMDSKLKESELALRKHTTELKAKNEQLQREISERKQAEKALRKLHKSLEQRVAERTFELQASRASFHNIVERSADGIVVTDRKGVVLFANKTFESIFRRKSEELVGEMFGLPVITDEMTEVSIIRKSGEPGVGEMSAVETEWEDEPAYLVLLRDITERRQVERDMLIKDKAIASSVNAIAIADFDGNLTYANPAFLRMWGYDSEAEILGKSLLEFWSMEEPDQKIVEILNEKGSWQGEIVKNRKNGLEFYSRLSMSMVRDSDDKTIAIMASFIDLTERRREEEARERLNQQLQAKISELEAFSYGIAHDLKSPLLSVEGFSRLLRADMQNKRLEKVQEDIRLLESGVGKMQQFLNGTLEYSRAGYQIKRTKNVDFGKIVEEVLEEFAEQLRSIGATLSLAETLPKVYMDRMRIKQVLTNLIQNSIDYRDKTVPLKIEIGHRLSNGEAVFFVRDNGIGIDESETEKVFDLFYRGTTDSKGSGIGLAIVKRIIEAHGGRIWAEDQSGKGTTMCFALPQKATQTMEAANGEK